MQQGIQGIGPMVLVVTIAALGSTAPVLAQSRESVQVTASEQVRTQERIYGEELMTPAERNAYREQMQSLGSEEERAALREFHRKEMQSRAAERGVTLPEQAAQARPGEARLGPAPAGQSQSTSSRSHDRQMDQDAARQRSTREDTTRDRPQGQGKSRSPRR